MSQLTKQQERALYVNMSSPINQLDDFEKEMLEVNGNSCEYEHYHINTSVDHGNGIVTSSVYPARHIIIVNKRKLWKDDGDDNSVSFDNGLIVNGKKYKIVGDEWVAQ